MTYQQAMATGLGMGVATAAAAVAYVYLLRRKEDEDEGLKSAVAVVEAVAASSLTSSQADERRRRSRFRRNQAAEATVVGCASRNEYLSCIDRYLDESDNVVMIRGTNDGTPSKDGGDSAGEERAVQIVGPNRVRAFERDIWDVNALIALAAQLAGGTVTAVCMETGNLFGNDILCDTLALIRMLRSVLAPHIKTILVQSRAMALHGRCFHDSRVVLAMPPLRRQQLEIASRSHCQVLATIGVNDYRDTTIPFVVRPGSSVLEIGCCVGTTTFLLADAAGNDGSAVGIDCGKLCIERARRTLEKRECGRQGKSSARVRFEVADGWDMSTLIQLASSMHAPFDVIYIDVGGLSVSVFQCTHAAATRATVPSMLPTQTYMIRYSDGRDWTGCGRRV